MKILIRFITILLIFLFISISITINKRTDISRKDLNYPPNLVFKDRNGKVLRFMLDKYGERHLWIPSNEIPARLKQAFLVAEDKEFYSHHGFRINSIIRAFIDNLKSGHIVSGASTVTQQVVKLIKKRKRTYFNKFLDIVESIKLESMLKKESILEQYLNRVPLGNNIRGVKLASLVYFGKSCNDLNYAECAFLASLPKSPGQIYSSGNYSKKLEDRKNWILFHLNEQGYLDKKELSDALQFVICLKMKKFSMEGSHFVNQLLKKYKNKNGDVFTTLDLYVQKNLEKILISHREKLNKKGADQASVLIIKNAAMEVIAMAGSYEYSRHNKGFNNGTNALRSPGSTLKPFLYALAIDSGFSPSLVLTDIEKIYKAPKGDYIPKNYDKNQYGPVTMRTALGNSLNLSAINMLEQIGYNKFFDLLTKINLVGYPEKGYDYYGLGMAIGNPETTLQQLVACYAMLANL